MISAHVRKSFINLYPRNASFLREPRCHSSTALLHLFSTSTKKEGKESKSVRLYLKEIGLSDVQVKNVFKLKTQRRSINVEKFIKPKIKAFRDFGFSDSEIAEIISKVPNLLCCSTENRIIPGLIFLNDFLGSRDDVFKVLKRSWWFSSCDMKKNVLPNIEQLSKHGVPMERIRWLFITNPRCMHITPESMRRYLDKMEMFQLDRSSGMYVPVFRMLLSLRDETWGQKMQTFRDAGFSESEILEMLKKYPTAFCRSCTHIKYITGMILSTNRYSKEAIVCCSQVYGYSLEKRLKPRLQVLEMLEEMDLIAKWPSLKCVAMYTCKQFHGVFVAPYLNQLEEACAARMEKAFVDKCCGVTQRMSSCFNPVLFSKLDY
ncbi:hypothetical protein M569_08877 [Genlisea aurea]|uniref:Mitochondrial transcription termination factor family protein n=1 Tax=Genlisea aurea TaxID=192259 RepID=S8DS26_9LAMI|nr:hypothetical protein M569_08877 [Genlisea aurea]